MIPIGIELEQKRRPVVNYALLAANVLLFLVTLFNEPLKNTLALPARDLQPVADAVFVRDVSLLRTRRLSPAQLKPLVDLVRKYGVALLLRKDDPQAAEIRRQYAVDVHGYHDGGAWARPYTLITHGFMHAGWMHLIGNMIFLWLFGNALNSRLGHVGYGASYLFFLLVAAMAHYYTANAPAVGASGAIAGVSGACLVYYPFVRVRALVPLFYIYHRIRIPVILYIGFEFALNIWQELGGVQNGVAYMAHIGGYVSGFVLAVVLLVTRVTRWTSGPFDLLTWFKQRIRRNAIRRVEQQTPPGALRSDPRADDDDDDWY